MYEKCYEAELEMTQFSVFSHFIQKTYRLSPSLVSFLRPLITSAVLAAVWQEIKNWFGYFKQLMLFFLEVVAFGIFTSLLEQSGRMGKGQLRKNIIPFLLLHH